LAESIFVTLSIEEARKRVCVDIDHVFAYLFFAQWLFAILAAALLQPSGTQQVLVAAFGGAAIALGPLVLTAFRSGWWVTRHTVAVMQVAFAALLDIVTRHEIEAEFDVFVALALLALYRDWRVFPTAFVAVVADTLIRGMIAPTSVYGVADPAWWRPAEHVAWVAFEGVVVGLVARHGEVAMREAADREMKMQAMLATIEVRVKNRTHALRESLDRFRALAESTAAIPFEYDPNDHELVYVAPHGAALFGCDVAKLVGLFDELVYPEDRERLHAHIDRVCEGDPTAHAIDYRMLSGFGQVLHVRALLGSRSDTTSKIRGIVLDITNQTKLESELRQAQKLESVGRLAAGVAHEINTPIQFVNDSIQFVRDATSDLLAVIAKHEAATASVIAGQPSVDAANEATAAAEAADIPYVSQHLPEALDRALDGIDRVATIVRSLKAFAHPDHGEMSSVDLNAAIQSTLTMARNEYKYVAELETELGDLPPVTCYLGEINQVVLNLVINSAHAIADVVAGTDKRGKITVKTRAYADRVEITIGDTGGGIPEAIRDRIFDPFFTTKEVGKGTGQGLAIARSVVVDKHGGELTFETTAGRGTTFRITIPVEPAVDTAREAA
jgi:PAS domain S-box-containing protein